MTYHERDIPGREPDRLTTHAVPDAGDGDRVQSSSIDSFPASDPPSWGSLRVGPPRLGRDRDL